MSNAQRESLHYWVSIMVKIAMGITGGVLIMLYSNFQDQAIETRDELRHSIDKIEITTKDMQGTLNDIEARTRVIEYRVKQIEK